uniref:Uncharacterized protein n=1 Tax=Rhizophora mucronata TaxID=61149 RepID=A0A2P2JGA2_RHIMU
MAPPFLTWGNSSRYIVHAACTKSTL